jgi:aryl-alcohol dehydrogenase-like predicted oxidoreductase
MTNDRNMAIADAVVEAAGELGATPTSVALAWLLARPGVTSLIIGPRTFEQYEQYQDGFELTLPPEVAERLDQATSLPGWATHLPGG